MDVRLNRNDLYPEIEPYASGVLPLDGCHVMFWEQAGNPDGVPVLFLHGGPGAGASSAHRRFFDPTFYRIVVFDQRGCGRSVPHAEVKDNTTAHLVQDIETLRTSLGIERWLLFGGSWGSTLALAYATRYPQHCSGLIIRGIFLGSREEVDWFLYGMGTFFPEAWQAFREFLPRPERGDLLNGYYRRLIHPSPSVHNPAAAAWSRYETACSHLLARSHDTWPLSNGDPTALALARLESHYFINRLFLRENELLTSINAVRHIPAVIVQGRYDMVCPIRTADALARAWPEAHYAIIPDAGHSAMEPGIRVMLVRATESLKSEVS